MVEAINNSGFLKNDLYSTIVSIVCILVIAYFISKLLNKPIKKFNKKNTKVILRLKNICVWAFAVYGIANQFNAFADIITAIAASTGVITLALSLAAQDAVSEFISGMMILSFKPFTVNDIIRITDYNIIGTVVDINIRHTLIRTIENTELIVPNSILNKAILRAHELECKFDSWGEFFDYEKWMQAFKDVGINPNYYSQRVIDLNEILAWDHINIMVTKEFLKREYNNALAEKVTKNCRAGCAGCGVNKFECGVCFEK